MTVNHPRLAEIDGVNIFYRQAGPANAPVVLLLHDFPTSSHMFRNLIPALADRYHVVALGERLLLREAGAKSNGSLRSKNGRLDHFSLPLAGGSEDQYTHFYQIM